MVAGPHMETVHLVEDVPQPGIQVRAHHMTPALDRVAQLVLTLSLLGRGHPRGELLIRAAERQPGTPSRLQHRHLPAAEITGVTTPQLQEVTVLRQPLVRTGARPHLASQLPHPGDGPITHQLQGPSMRQHQQVMVVVDRTMPLRQR
jgi:hypothetical protein